MEDLVEAGLVEASDRPAYGPDTRRRGRGRPARVYHLTQAGRDSFGNAYDDVAVGALRFVAETGGEDAVMEFARRRVAELERRYSDLLDLTEPMDVRVDVLADALAAEGYAAVAVPTATGIPLCQHNSPVAHVAAEFPQFCEAETEAFGRLLGTHVMRLATLSHGDGVCTTHIPTAIGPNSAAPCAPADLSTTPDGRTT
jgi:predicted ArsR family transcriptional regulator